MDADTDADAQVVRCLVLPVRDDQVLLPSAVVAEIFAVREIPPLEDGPQWLLGSVAWREGSLPVVSIEAAVGSERAPAGARAKIVVLRALGTEKTLEYYALLIQGIPRQVIASAQTVQSRSRAGGERPFVAKELSLEGEPAFIPDLDALERALLAFAPSWKQEAPVGNGNSSGL